MPYRHLGRTGLQVSRLALGTMNFGELTDETASFDMMDKALDAGINFFDTADVYGGPQSPDMEKGFGGLPRRPSVGGSPRAAVAIGLFWQPSYTSRWAPARTIAVSRHITFGGLVRPAFDDCGPITSTSTRCTMSIDALPGTRSGRRWSSWSGRAR